MLTDAQAADLHQIALASRVLVFVSLLVVGELLGLAWFISRRK